jgi:nitroreductase
MQSFMEIVTARRSIRRFESRPIEDEKMMRILGAARWTPSWANTQCWELIAVKDEKLLQSLAEELSPKNPATLAVAKGPVTLVICAEKNKAGYYNGKPSTTLGDWLMFDLGLITQTICLAAHAEGLGSVVVGAFNHDKVKDILGVPEGYEVAAMLPMGYPAHAPSSPKRRDVKDFLHYDSFGSKG